MQPHYKTNEADTHGEEIKGLFLLELEEICFDLAFRLYNFHLFQCAGGQKARNST